MIKRKAYERGLIDETRLASISDEETTMLVFAAGFSTAETVSDVPVAASAWMWCAMLSRKLVAGSQ